VGTFLLKALAQIVIKVTVSFGSGGFEGVPVSDVLILSIT
jgi:hypothetical protein